MSAFTPLVVKVWGDLACFTRPEMKVERVTYEVMTPSAARGVLEAILWKPEFRWRVLAIHVLKPIQRISILRNELKSKAAVRTVQAWARDGGGYLADADRTQRHTLALRDVAYRIEADVQLLPHAQGSHAAKYRDQFRRRVARGQCFQQPYLGCREFAAHFGEPEDEPAIDVSEDLGRMLFDLAYGSDGDRIVPRFFQAHLEKGVLRVPQELYQTTDPPREKGEDYAAPSAG